MSVQDSCTRNAGYLRKWNGTWGIVFCPGRRYFLHISNVRSGEPKNGARCNFDVSPARSEGDLDMAVNAEFIAVPVAGVRQ
jgi:hypothetical protein